jgi:hypothetical protein
MASYNRRVAPLGALSHAWTAAEGAKPLGWDLVGVWQFRGEWVALSTGPEFDDYVSGSGRHADQALRRLGERLQQRRGPTTG